MLDNILKFFSKDDLQLGMGISTTSEIKMSPFESTQLQTETNKLNNDEFGYYVISESKDYEKIKNFNFGIDLRATLPSLKYSFNSEFDKTFKSNEIVLQAYRKIITSEISMSSQQFPLFSDDAVNILTNSTAKFHEIYGDYYINKLVKGGALSVSTRIQADSIEDKNSLSTSLKANGEKVIVKGDIGTIIEWKKNELSSRTMNECVSTSIGLETEIKSTDFQKMLTELEQLDKRIEEGSIIFYVICKYELNSQYIKILNKKTKWQLFLEKFECLNLQIQQQNLDLYQQISDMLKVDDKNDQKVKEIQVEIKINELQEKSNELDLDKRMLKCAELIQANNISLAVELIGLYGTNDFIYKLISNTFKNETHFEQVLGFTLALPNINQKAAAFLVMLQVMKISDLFYSTRILRVGYHVKKLISKNQLTNNSILKAFFIQLRKMFPQSIQNLLWESYVCIKNEKFQRYLYNSNEYFEFYDRDLKRVFTSSSNNFDESAWQLESYDEGKTYTLMNKSNKEFLFTKPIIPTPRTHEKFLFNSSRLVPDTLVMTRAKLTDASFWIIEPIDNEVVMIYNAQTKDYMYGESFQKNIIRGDVYARQESLERKWTQAQNEHRLFRIEKEFNLLSFDT